MVFGKPCIPTGTVRYRTCTGRTPRARGSTGAYQKCKSLDYKDKKKHRNRNLAGYVRTTKNKLEERAPLILGLIQKIEAAATNQHHTHTRDDDP